MPWQRFCPKRLGGEFSRLAQPTGIPSLS